MSTRFHIRTYGCQMNQRDSEALACMLCECGMVEADGEADADVLLFNTCSVRDQAERKALGKIGILKRLKRKRPHIVIGVIGCMAQNYGRDLLERAPHVDLVVGTDRLHLLPEILADVLNGHRGQVHVEPGSEGLGMLRGHQPGAVSSFVSVMRGCDQFCSYCIVPYVRGRERSRTVAEVVDEVRGLVAGGTREIFLLGQNITAYGLAEARREGRFTPDISPFADLLTAVDHVDGVARLRFTSPHPKYMNEAFVAAVTGLPTVCESLHIPLQSGSDPILKTMGRGYTRAGYLARIEAIRSGLPDVTFSTDIIVGFPGETEADFQATRQVMTKVGFDMAYIFKYSPRSGTAAAKLPDDVPQEVKEQRNAILLADLETRAAAANTRYIGTTVEALVEGPSKRNQTRWQGRTRTNKVCIFPPTPNLPPGALVDITINRTTPNTLFGHAAEYWQ